MKRMALIFSLVLLALPVWASDGVLTYFIATDYWPPFRIQDSKKGLAGIDLDIMEEVGRRMNVRFVWNKRPWARCMEEMQTGETDLMTGVAKTPEREMFISYSAIPYHTCAPAFYVNKGNLKKPIDSYEELRELAIGYVRDSAYFEQFDKDKGLRKVAGNTEDQLVKMLLENRYDAIIGTDCQVDYDLRKRNLSDKIVQIKYQPDHKIDLYVGVSRQSSFMERMDEFNRVLSAMQEDGTIAAIVRRYIGNIHNE